MWLPVVRGSEGSCEMREGGGDPLMRSYCADDGPSEDVVTSLLIPAISSPN